MISLSTATPCDSSLVFQHYYQCKVKLCLKNHMTWIDPCETVLLCCHISAFLLSCPHLNTCIRTRVIFPLSARRQHLSLDLQPVTIHCQSATQLVAGVQLYLLLHCLCLVCGRKCEAFRNVRLCSTPLGHDKLLVHVTHPWQWLCNTVCNVILTERKPVLSTEESPPEKLTVAKQTKKYTTVNWTQVAITVFKR
jgi:hypothetical protein